MKDNPKYQAVPGFLIIASSVTSLCYGLVHLLESKLGIKKQNSVIAYYVAGSITFFVDIFTNKAGILKPLIILPILGTGIMAWSPLFFSYSAGRKIRAWLPQ